ncbi:MAG: Holliday junction resolvase RusA-like endonuclease, partial [Myxococcota bacterium]
RLVLKTFIPGTPKPKERPRGHVKKDGTLGFRSGKSTSIWEKHARQVLQFARQQAGMHGPVPRDVPLRLDVLVVFDRVKRLGDGPRVRHIVTPDADNVLKALKDALDGGKPRKGNRPGTPGLIVTDDCQITSVSTAKWYAATGEKPGVHLRLWRLDQAPDIGPGESRRTDKTAPAPDPDIGPGEIRRTDETASTPAPDIGPGEIRRTDRTAPGTASDIGPGEIRRTDRTAPGTAPDVGPGEIRLTDSSSSSSAPSTIRPLCNRQPVTELPITNGAGALGGEDD